mgnify:CR=1 FL=1
MASIFTKIVQGEIPCHKVAETDNCLAFLDINPLAKGHTLVIPKPEIDYLFDVQEPLYGELMTFAQKVAKAIDATMTCERVGMAVVGLEVPHAHIHLIPISHVHDIDFSRPKLDLTQEELAAIAKEIAEVI